MNARLPDRYFEDMYADSADPWELSTRWYEHRKRAIILAMLPRRRYMHAFEPGCSVGTLTSELVARCDRVTSTDVTNASLTHTDQRLRKIRRRHQVTLLRESIDRPWPTGPFDLVVLSEVCYYLQPKVLRTVLDRESRRLAEGATILSAHWRHPVADYPMSGDEANSIVAATPGFHSIGRYQDPDVLIEVFDTVSAASVAVRGQIPGAVSPETV